MVGPPHKRTKKISLSMRSLTLKLKEVSIFCVILLPNRFVVSNTNAAQKKPENVSTSKKETFFRTQINLRRNTLMKWALEKK